MNQITTIAAAASAIAVYQPQALALVEVEADPVDGADLADHLVEKTAHDGEVLLQVAHGKECLLRHRALVSGRRSNGRL